MVLSSAPELLTYPERFAARLERDAADGLANLKGARRTPFPKIEGLLNVSEYQAILWQSADREAMSRYPNGRVDFLFHELCPEEGERVRRHGAGAEPGDVLSREEVLRCEHAMFCAMLVAVVLRQHADDPGAVPVSWRSIVRFARDLAAQTFTLVPSAPLQ